MGLDMYIYEVKPKGVCYWRKFNALHAYIVDKYGEGEDDCKPIWLGAEEIKDIIKLLKEVQSDHNKANELLPTSKGFFFGSQEYDEWYFQNIDDAIGQLEALNLSNHDVEYLYQASW